MLARCSKGVNGSQQWPPGFCGKDKMHMLLCYSVQCLEMNSRALLCRYQGNRMCVNYNKRNYSQENLLSLGYVIVFTADYSLLLSVPLIYFTHLSFEIEMKCWSIIVLQRKIYLFLLLR